MRSFSWMLLLALLLLCAVSQAASEKASEKTVPSSSVASNREEVDADLKELLGDEIASSKEEKEEEKKEEEKKEEGKKEEEKKVEEGKSSKEVEEEKKKAGEQEEEEPDLMGDDDDDEDSDEASSEDHKDTAPKAASNETETDEQVFLPEEGSAEKEHSNSLSLFFVLIILILCVFLVHFTLQLKCHAVPESLAIVFLGAMIGLFMKMLPTEDLKRVESFSPTMFFLVLLPPIIFESGYNLHKGNFFTNIGSILLFAILGTTISALIVGGGIYLLGLADVVYKLDFIQSFAFGSLISAVDPVATLAIFQALDVEPVLNMLVFGESILNDAVAIVLTTTVLESDLPEMASLTSMQQVWYGVHRFLVIFLGSAGIGALVGVVSSLTLKHIDLYTNPSLEFALMLCCVYSPYALAEGIHLSGIMSILFCGIVMSQYTHYNLSPVTQITMQQTMRTLSFICESCVFAYIGLAIFSFPHRFELALVVWSVIFILVGRAFNIFPLAALCNRFRSHQITKKMMIIMWFSGLRGAIAYALCLHLEFPEETRKVLVTTTLCIVLFTTIGLGGSTMPLMKYLESRQPRKNRRGRKKEITLSKTKELGATIDSEHLSEMTEEELELSTSAGEGGSTTGLILQSNRVKGFLYYDVKYIRPFLTRRFTQRELREGRSHVTQLTDKWIQDLQGSPLMLTDSEEGEFNQEQD